VASESDAGVFVRVDCTCGRRDVFLKCEQCGRQSLFTVESDGVRCQCGASYSHGVCACGEEVRPPKLVAVPFDQGPVVAGEMELDPVRVGGLAVVLLAVLGAVGWWWFL
jgi:hypothetical protein